MAKVICDTNIWYGIGNGTLKKSDYSNDKLLLTLISIIEVGTTYNLLDMMDDARKAIQAMIKLNDGIIEEQPFVYLANLAGCKIQYDTRKEHGSILDGTQAIANGHDIQEERRSDFKKWLDEMEMPLNKFADFTNDKLLEIRTKIENKKEHAKEETTQGNRALIAQWTEMSTQGKGNLNNLDWSQVELFENTMTSFFKEMELTGNMKFQPNDFFDLMNLVYVQPGDKYFTLEKRWVTRIKNAGMEKYLLK